VEWLRPGRIPQQTGQIRPRLGTASTVSYPPSLHRIPSTAYARRTCLISFDRCFDSLRLTPACDFGVSEEKHAVCTPVSGVYVSESLTNMTIRLGVIELWVPSTMSSGLSSMSTTTRVSGYWLRTEETTSGLSHLRHFSAWRCEREGAVTLRSQGGVTQSRVYSCSTVQCFPLPGIQPQAQSRRG
jgi:hypothetical protein